MQKKNAEVPSTCFKLLNQYVGSSSRHEGSSVKWGKTRQSYC